MNNLIAAKASTIKAGCIVNTLATNAIPKANPILTVPSTAIDTHRDHSCGKSSHRCTSLVSYTVASLPLSPPDSQAPEQVGPCPTPIEWAYTTASYATSVVSASSH